MSDKNQDYNITPDQMKQKIEDSINKLEGFGYSRKEAEAIIERGMKHVAAGTKDIRDIIEL